LFQFGTFGKLGALNKTNLGHEPLASGHAPFATPLSLVPRTPLAIILETK
jgi:hypothetical protein